MADTQDLGSCAFEREGSSPFSRTVAKAATSADLLGSRGYPADGLADREVSFYASTFTQTPDSYGDIVAPGAFTQTLAEWDASGNTLPVLYGHNLADPAYNVAGATEVTQDDHGLLVKATFDQTPLAEQVYSLVKAKRLSQASFAFDVLDQEEVQTPTGPANELRNVKLYEVSLVPVGANSDAGVVAVKAGPRRHADALALRLRLLDHG